MATNGARPNRQILLVERPQGAAGGAAFPGHGQLNRRAGAG